LKDKVTPPASGSARPKPLTLPVPTSSH
jgi:hypothetical protein